MCTLRHILPQGAMNTFNKATEEGELKWVNLLDATHTYRVCVCVCVLERETIASAITWSGSKSEDQGHVPFSSSMNLSSVSENEIKRFILQQQTSCWCVWTRDNDRKR